jgi:prefoldin subunit 5
MKQKNTIIELLSSTPELTKTNVKSLAEAMISDIESGQTNLFETASKIEFMIQTLDQVMTSVREQLVDELHKYGNESKVGVKTNGVTFKMKETGVKYDYSNTALWVAKKQAIDELTNDLKSLESTLKSVQTKMTTVDEQTGEIIEFWQPIKSSKTSVEITLSK